MNFIWSSSCSEEAAGPPTLGQRIVTLDPGKDPVAFAAQYQCAVIIVEVRNAEDTQRVFRLIEHLQGKFVVWVYQPSATVESTVIFMRNGASHVMTSIEEIERAMNSAQEIPSPETVSHKTLIGVSRSIQ